MESISFFTQKGLFFTFVFVQNCFFFIRRNNFLRKRGRIDLFLYLKALNVIIILVEDIVSIINSSLELDENK